ncbi:UNVERIFIED_ORG: uncharacterized protein DUF2639 [Anoxybacillus amylolyticus]|uniref:DUF2639 domain-containing protein n=1 Tax=Geobacillus kaustophilus TaxID=1462 RepID=A0A0D8BSG9_GEOKU|nr:hypothetical protein LG52_1190 [Geobacillus kaustophilus]
MNKLLPKAFSTFVWAHIYKDKPHEKGGGAPMAHFGSKGWLVAELKKAGIARHPVGRKKIETYKATELYGLYRKYVQKTC